MVRKLPKSKSTPKILLVNHLLPPTSSFIASDSQTPLGSWCLANSHIPETPPAYHDVIPKEYARLACAEAEPFSQPTANDKTWVEGGPSINPCRFISDAPGAR
jgi:hypothetical protein